MYNPSVSSKVHNTILHSSAFKYNHLICRGYSGVFSPFVLKGLLMQYICEFSISLLLFESTLLLKVDLPCTISGLSPFFLLPIIS